MNIHSTMDKRKNKAYNNENEAKTKFRGTVLAFAALDPYIETNIVSSEENIIQGQNFIEFGTKNQFPQYVYDLYKNVPTLSAIVNTIVDYGCGNDIKSNTPIIDNKDILEFARKVIFDLALYNGSYINVLRNKFGKIVAVSHIDYRNVRSNIDNTLFYYSEEYSTKSYGRCKYTVYPKFEFEKINDLSSIYYIKGTSYSTYALPIWNSAITSCEVERCINEYQLNEINNGFMSNVMISFNNGVPLDEQKEEIQEQLNEKFGGYQNAGRPLVSFSPDKEHAPEIIKLDSDTFADRYEKVEERARQQILTAFRTNGNLVGIPTAQGFNSEEYQSSYQLFYNTTVKPIQHLLINAINEIAGCVDEVNDSIQIEPFKIDFGN